MRLRLVTAGVGTHWESALTQACQDGGVRAVVVQRCYELGDLLAAAAAGRAEVALVASTMRWLDRETVTRLQASGLAVVGVVPPGDEDAERRLHQLGISHVTHGTVRPGTLVELARAALAGRSAPRSGPNGGGRAAHLDHPAGSEAAAGPPWPPSPLRSTNESGSVIRPIDAVRGGAAAPVVPGPGARPAHDVIEPGSGDEPSPDADDEGSRNVVVVVWGPKGAPGRTTVAVNLAFEALPLAGETLLVDADTYGGSVAQILGFLEEHQGLAWAARLASRGELDRPRLWEATRRAGPNGPRVLSGLTRAELWTEIGSSTWDSLLDLFRLSFPVTVVDVGFCLEEDEELLYDHVRFRRNAVARLALQRADHVIAVARADPVGLHDFVWGYQQLRDAGVNPSRVRIVVNQVRGGLFGGDPVNQIRVALHRYLGTEPSAFVPYDRAGVDAALMLGKALREAQHGSPAQQAIAALAASLFGEPRPAPQRRRRFLRRAERRRAIVWDGNPSGPTMTFRNTGW